MPESPIRKLVPFAEAAKARGINVFHLNIGQPDIKTPELAIQAVKNIDMQVVEYSHSAGNSSYRIALAAAYQKSGIHVTPEELIITTGGSEAILFAINSITDIGDEVIIPEPFYANYNGFATASGVVVKPINSSIETGFSLPSIEAFEKNITSKTRAIIICNPGNPTGYLYSKAELNKLRDIVLKHDLYLIADEVYREFVYDGEVHHSILNLDGLEQHAIVIDSVSKRYSMCGVRVGTLISRNEELMATAMKFAQARLSPPTFGQIAAEAALGTPKSYFDKVTSEYIHRRDVMVEGLNAIEGVHCPTPKGAFYCVASLPVKDAEEFAQWLLEVFEYNNNTVMIAPATGFYSSPLAGLNQVRIAYVLKQANLKIAVEVLKRALEVYPGRTN